MIRASRMGSGWYGLQIGEGISNLQMDVENIWELVMTDGPVILVNELEELVDLGLIDDTAEVTMVEAE